MFTKRVVFRSLSVFLFLAVTFFLCSQILSTQAAGQEMWYEEELEAMPEWLPGVCVPFLSRNAGWGFWYEKELEAIPDWLPGIWMPGGMIYSVCGMGYSRKGAANGYDLFFSYSSIMNAAPEPTSLTFNGRGIDLNKDDQIAMHMDFTGSYLVTIAYEDGSTKLGELLVSKLGAQIVIDLIYPDTCQVYSGRASVNGDEISFSLTATMNAAPEPTSLTFNGRGIDLNEDEKVDTLGGYFYGSECTDTCDEVVGDFDAYAECTDTCDEVVGDFDAYVECTDTCDEVVGDFDAYI